MGQWGLQRSAWPCYPHKMASPLSRGKPSPARAESSIRSEETATVSGDLVPPRGDILPSREDIFPAGGDHPAQQRGTLRPPGKRPWSPLCPPSTWNRQPGQRRLPATSGPRSCGGDVCAPRGEYASRRKPAARHNIQKARWNAAFLTVSQWPLARAESLPVRSLPAARWTDHLWFPGNSPQINLRKSQAAAWI